jgi:hypothetical protein
MQRVGNGALFFISFFAVAWGCGRLGAEVVSGIARKFTSCEFPARRVRATANEVMTSCQLRERRNVPETTSAPTRQNEKKK